MIRRVASPGKPESAPAMFCFEEICDKAYQEYLPVIGALAAGDPNSGFEIDNQDAATECSWVAVPRRLAGRNRFVIRINGDSMEPELKMGDWVVFEYHRSPRGKNQIVIANIPELGITSGLSTDHAVKRLFQDADFWIFKSANPRYEDIPVAKNACDYPILGVMVGRLSTKCGHVQMRR